MKNGKVNICGRVLDIPKGKLSGKTLRELLNIKKDRTLIKKDAGGHNQIIEDDDILNIPDRPNKLFFDDIPTLREGF